MKQIGRFFVIIRKDKAPSMVTTEAYVMQLKRVDSSLMVMKFLKSHDATHFISNYNLQLDQSKKDVLLKETQIRQRVEIELSDRVKGNLKQTQGVSVQNGYQTSFFVGYREGDDFPLVYKSRVGLSKLGYPEENITKFRTKQEALQFVVDIISKETKPASQTQQVQQINAIQNAVEDMGKDQSTEVFQNLKYEKDHNMEEIQNLKEDAMTSYIPESASEQSKSDLLSVQQQDKMKLRFNKIIELNQENYQLFRWYKIKMQSTVNPDLQYRLFFDGSTQVKLADTNSAGGIVIYEGDKRIYKIGIFVGSVKSNAAEFHGLLYGLRAALELGITQLDVFGDSEVIFFVISKLIIRFMTGKYKVKDEILKDLYKCTKKYAELFETITYSSIPRLLNVEADEIANKSREKFVRYLEMKKKK